MGTTKYSDAQSSEEMAEKIDLVEKTDDPKIDVERGGWNTPVETTEETE